MQKFPYFSDSDSDQVSGSTIPVATPALFSPKTYDIQTPKEPKSSYDTN